MNHSLSDALSAPRLGEGATRAASARTAALVAADGIAFLLASALALALQMVSAAAPQDSDDLLQVLQDPNWHGWGTMLVAAVLLGYFGSRGHYTARVPFWTELNGVTGGVCVAFLCDSFLRTGVYAVPFGFEAIARWVLFVPCLLLLRQGARWLLQRWGMWSLRTVIVGERDAVAGARAALISEKSLGYQVVNTLSLESAALLLQNARGPGALAKFGGELVVLAMGGDDPATESRVAAALARSQVPFALVPAFEGVPVAGISSHYFFSHDIMLLTCGNNLARPVRRLLKGVFDQAVAAMLLAVLSPLFLLLCAIIRLDGGPAFFGHRRIGQGGTTFRCLKFRTMTVNSDAVLRDLVARDPAVRAEWLATQKLRSDPRVTRIGRILRETSLDELPQLVNVLRGEMSLVGPRPIVDAEIERYGDKISFYYETKPGITGLWQVSGRSNTSYEHRVKLDVWYARNWTLWHDIAIMMKTVPAVFLKDGAV